MGPSKSFTLFTAAASFTANSTCTKLPGFGSSAMVFASPHGDTANDKGVHPVLGGRSVNAPTGGFVACGLIIAVGPDPDQTVTGMVITAEPPSSSSTVTVIQYLPAAAYSCVAVAVMDRGFASGLGSGSGKTAGSFGNSKTSTVPSPQSTLRVRSSLPGSVALAVRSTPLAPREAGRSPLHTQLSSF